MGIVPCGICRRPSDHGELFFFFFKRRRCGELGFGEEEEMGVGEDSDLLRDEKSFCGVVAMDLFSLGRWKYAISCHGYWNVIAFAFAFF